MTSKGLVHLQVPVDNPVWSRLLPGHLGRKGEGACDCFPVSNTPCQGGEGTEKEHLQFSAALSSAPVHPRSQERVPGCGY